MIRLHHAPQSRSMRSLWLLYELGLEFDLVTHDFGAGLQSPEYRAINHAGRVPTLEVDGMCIRESGAIAQLLCERSTGKGLGRDPCDPERPAWLDWIHFAETISVHVAVLTQQHIVLFDDAMRSPVIMKIEAKRLARTLQSVDHALGQQDYLLPRGFSAADIGVGQAVYMSQHFVSFDDMPRLRAWYDRITTRPAFIRSCPGPNDALIYKKAFYAPWVDTPT